MDHLPDPGVGPHSDPTLEADLAWYYRMRDRMRPDSPSPRTPKVSWHENAADKIDHQMKEDNHQIWGFVIYRSSYHDNDTDWAEFLRRLRTHMEQSFKSTNGNDGLERFRLTVFEDAQLFNGPGSVDAIRWHFQQWCLDAAPVEQRQGGEEAPIPTIGRSPRYHFAIQVDDEALQSVVQAASDPPSQNITEPTGWVNLIDKAWYLGRGHGQGLAPLQEPLRGLTVYDVGWMRVPYDEVMDDHYAGARDPSYWTKAYRRPPEISSF